MIVAVAYCPARRTRGVNLHRRMDGEQRESADAIVKARSSRKPRKPRAGNPPRPDFVGLRAQFLRAGATGLVAGTVALVFNLLLRYGENLRSFMLGYAHGLAYVGIVVWPVCAALLAMASLWLVQRFAPEAAGSGIPHIKAVLQHQAQLNWKRVIPVKMLAGAAALAAGLSLGREGPTVQLGAAAAQLVALLLHLPRRSQNQLIAAGAGAGLSAAFNSPLAGFVFVIEELRRELSPLTSSIALIAAIVADVVSREFLGQQPSFYTRAAGTPPLSSLPLFLLIGVAAAFLGVAFNRTLIAAVRAARSLSRPLKMSGIGLLAAVIGLASWWYPQVSGGGYETAQMVLRGQIQDVGDLPWLLALLVARFAFTILSYASGTSGGIFAPMLAMGAVLGLSCGIAATQIWHGAANLPVAVAVVAMAALFAAVVRAPLTGIVLILEMTANYELLLPLMVASMTAFLIAERLRVAPVYESLLELSQHGTVGSGEAIWFDVVVEDSSQLEGTRIADLPWPDGCHVAVVIRGTKELAPRRDLELCAGDLLRIVAETEDSHFAAHVAGQARGSAHNG
jgi:CIC family chloride channel protein